MIRNVTRFLAAWLYKPLLIKWLSHERRYARKGIQLRIHPDVFHPGFFFSTGLLLKHLLDRDLAGKKVLELGAGSGLIAITAAKKGAVVTASDINPVAIDYLCKNARNNLAGIKIIESDLFVSIPVQAFDIVVINPPYYFHDPVHHRDYAWYCGKNGEYFHRLFASLGNYLHAGSVILMVLCEGSRRSEIQSIAAKWNFGFHCLRTHYSLVERNYVYRVFQSNSLSASRRYEKNTLIQPEKQ